MNNRLKFVFKVFKLYSHSYYSLHVIAIILSALITFIITQSKGAMVDMTNYTDIVNGLGVLTSFFIVALDKLDFQELKNKFKTIKKTSKSASIEFGKKLINTVFSLTVSMFVTLGVTYLLLLFNMKYIFLLVILVIYIFIGFTMVLLLWHALELDR